MPDTKAPLWKQILGAVGGAAVAFVVYQGYAFTSNHLTALITLPTGSGITDRRTSAPNYVRPRGTLDSPVFVSSSSIASSAASSVPAVGGSTSSNRVFLGPFGVARGLKKFFAFNASSSAAAVAFTTPLPVNVHAAAAPAASFFLAAPYPSASAPVPADVPERMPLPVSNVPRSRPVPITIYDPTPGGQVAASVASGQRNLTKSGFGLDVLALMALGGVIGRRKAKRA